MRFRGKTVWFRGDPGDLYDPKKVTAVASRPERVGPFAGWSVALKQYYVPVKIIPAVEKKLVSALPRKRGRPRKVRSGKAGRALIMRPNKEHSNTDGRRTSFKQIKK